VVFCFEWVFGLAVCGPDYFFLLDDKEAVMFDSFGDFFWSFMALSGVMFWVCLAGFVMLVVKRNREKRRFYRVD
jgi:hypothetical protein